MPTIRYVSNLIANGRARAAVVPRGRGNGVGYRFPVVLRGGGSGVAMVGGRGGLVLVCSTDRLAWGEDAGAIVTGGPALR